MQDAIYIALCLSVPFMFGVIVGREIRKEAPLTAEHHVGAEIIAQISRVQIASRVSGGLPVNLSATYSVLGQPKVTIMILKEGEPA